MVLRPEDGTPLDEKDKRLVERLRHFAHVLNDAADDAEALNYSTASDKILPIFDEITDMHLRTLADMAMARSMGDSMRLDNTLLN